MPTTERLYPPEQRPGGSLTAPLSAMGEKLLAEADKWRAMSEEAIATAKKTPAPAEPAPPAPPPTVDWGAELDREALVTRRRQPTDWAPTTVVLTAVAAQIVPYRPNRKSVTIVNTGANPCLVGATLGAVANQTSETFSVVAAATLSMEVEAAIWGISPAGTTLAVIETYYGAGHLNRAVANLVKLAIAARVGAPKPVGLEAPMKQGEKGLL